MYSRRELEGRGFGPHEVWVIENFILPLKDGIKIAMKIWLPKKAKDLFPNLEEKWCKKYCEAEGQIKVSFSGFHGQETGLKQPAFSCTKEEQEFPAVLEYLGYGKNTYTSERDHLRHPWLASHGYVFVRPDMRGTCDSEGLYFDEYTQQEFDDACEVIGWLADQKWSNGKVGMYGKSWGGFNGLQIAYCQPPALKAVISLYSLGIVL